MADTARSVSLSLGNDGFKHNDFTIGTNAPGAGDFELRYNATSNGYKIRRIDVLKAICAFERYLESMATFDTNLAG